ncbi:MAG: DNA translocase FtsK [Lachnospiraceae bacterium]|nr:DNA translocase FtsK [Lachnospiraceae bacterium]
MADTKKKSGQTAKKSGTGSTTKKNTTKGTRQQASGKGTTSRGTKSTSGKSGSSKKSMSGSGKSTASGRSTAAGRSTQSVRSTAKVQTRREPDTKMLGEVVTIGFFVLCAFLFLSNMGLCGKAGEVCANFMQGYFGALGFLLPILIFIAVIVLVNNADDSRIWWKTLLSAALYLLLCCLIQMVMIPPGTFDKTATVEDYYLLALSESSGGVVGGMFVHMVYPALGLVGTYLVLLFLLSVVLVLLTERSLIRPIRDGGREVIDRARDDHERWAREREIRRMEREEREQERRERENARREREWALREEGSRRMDQKVKGMTFRTSMSGQEETYEPIRGELHGIDNGYRSLWKKTDLGDGRADYAAKGQAAGADEQYSAAEVEELPGGVRRIVPAGQEAEATKRGGSAERNGMAEQREASEAADQMTSAKRKAPAEPAAKAGKGEKNLSFSLVDESASADVPGEGQVEKMPSAEQRIRMIPIRRGNVETDEKPEKDLMAKADSRSLEELNLLDEKRHPFGENGAEPLRMSDLTADLQVPAEGIHDTLHSRRKAGPAGMENENRQDKPTTDEKFAGVTGVNLEKATRTVTTASGQVIEADIDPDDDPIMRKRKAAQESIWASGDGKNRSSSGGHSFSLEGTPADDLSAMDGLFQAGGNGAGAQMRAGGTASNSGSGSFGKADGSGSGSQTRTGQMNHGSFAGGQAAGSPAKMEPEKKEPPKKPLLPYETPPITLLDKPKSSGGGASDEELQETALKLEQTLRSFNVGVTMSDISCGPSVTRYELQPDVGVKVSRIVSLSDDIKLNLAAEDIRIEAPIPGKAAVGIEVPNKKKQIVPLRDVLECDAFRNHKSKLAFGLGRSIGGECVVTDLAKMPHLLIAGSTGSGKSVCINTLIVSILYKAKPSEVELIMIDPKVVELSVYNGIPHLKIPVVTDPKKASAALNWAVQEMTDRYAKFAAESVRDLQGYNAKVKTEMEKGETDRKPLPQMVIIVDELADLMMVAPGEVEDAICRLAQMARAAGIHLVLATQRPSVNVITGLIKANVPSRIAFAVSSGIDSRTILDTVGAEKLLGKGDMLFAPVGAPKPSRIQGAFVSDEEVARIVEFLKERDSDEEKSGDTADVESSIFAFSGEGGDASGSSQEQDSYFEQAGRFLIEKDKASIGMLQRAFKIGFNRAARIMDQLAEAGVVGEEEGTKPRKILVTLEEFNQMCQR